MDDSHSHSNPTPMAGEPPQPAEDTTAPVPTLLALPMELQLHIFSHLDFASALAFCACTRLLHTALHPRMLPAHEKNRFIRHVENLPRNGGAWKALGVGCFACCRVRPAAHFERRQIWSSRETLRSPGAPAALLDGASRFCIECGVAGGVYRPGTVVYGGMDVMYVCKLCGGLVRQKPPACGRDLICRGCWADKGDGLEDVLCLFCRINRRRERAEEQMAEAEELEREGGDGIPLESPPSYETAAEEDEKRGSKGNQGKVLGARSQDWVRAVRRGLLQQADRAKTALPDWMTTKPPRER